MTDITVFDESKAVALPEALLQRGREVAAAFAGGVTGIQIARISIRGGRFRKLANGTETAITREDHLDVVFVHSSPDVGRTFYTNKFNNDAPKERPTCWSHTGLAPAEDVPLDQKQSNVCGSCPKNQKGSAADGSTARACAFRKTIIVAFPDEIQKGEAVPYQFIVNGQSIFADGDLSQKLFSLQGYARFLGEKRAAWPTGIPAPFVITRMSFDTDSSTPKLFFSPQGFLTPGACKYSLELGESEEVKQILALSHDEAALVQGDVKGGAAQVSVAPQAAAAPPPPPPKTPWKDYALSVEADPDDIDMIEAQGGPGTEKGKRLWDKLVGAVLSDDIDLGNADDAGEEEDTSTVVKKGRGPNKPKKVVEVKAEPTPKPAPAPAPAVASPVVAKGSFASQMSNFDD